MANNHNRYLGNSKQDFENGFNALKSSSTQKQRRFFIALKKKCKEHNIEEHEDPSGRYGFSVSIQKLIDLLKANGVDIKDSGKKFDTVVTVKDDPSILIDHDVEVRLKPSKKDV